MYDDCVTWLKEAKPGDRLVYHEGSLTFDRGRSPNLDMMASLFLGAAGYRFMPDGHSTMRWVQTETPRCLLVQRKMTIVGPKGWPIFAYIAIKR